MSRAAAVGRRWVPVALVLGLLVLAASLAGGRGVDGPPLDPASGGPSGTLGLVELVSELDGTVRLGDDEPRPGDDRALVLRDGAGEPADQRAERVRSWVADGGVAVVADPGSPIADVTPMGRTEIGFLETPIPRTCDLEALERVDAVAPGGALVLDGPDAAIGCYPRGDGFWLLAEPHGEGSVITLGSATTLTNRGLTEPAHAELAVALLAPEPGTRVAVLDAPGPGAGDRGLLEVLPGWVLPSLAGAATAFALLALALGVRLGKPIAERAAVAIPGSEIVRATAALRRRADARGTTAASLRDGLRRELCARYGLPTASAARWVAEVVADRADVPRELLDQALVGGEPADDAELVALAEAVDEVRRAALGGEPAASAGRRG